MRRATAAAVLVTLALAAPASAACTKTWDDGANDRKWSSAANWSGDTLPGSGDDVCIPPLSGAPVAVDTPVLVQTVAAQHPVNATSTLTLTDAAEDSSFTDLATSVTLVVQANHGLRTTGAVDWTSGTIEMHDGSAWENAGTFAANSETGSIAWSDDAGDGARPALVNSGTLEKTAGAGTTPVNASLDNTGTVAEDTGTLQLRGGGTLRAGGPVTAMLRHDIFTVTDGAQLVNIRIDGARVLVADGAEATIHGGEMTAGRLGGPGDVVIAPPLVTAKAASVFGPQVSFAKFFVKSGKVQGPGVIRVSSPAGLEMAGIPPVPQPPDPEPLENPPEEWEAFDAPLLSVQFVSGPHIVNEHELEWTSGAIRLDATTFHNAGQLLLNSTAHGWQGTEPVVNTGSITKGGGGGGGGGGSNTVPFPPVVNDGTIEVEGGTLRVTDLQQTSDGRVEIDVAGTTKGTEYGTIFINGQTLLSGMLAIDLADGYTPATGDVFHVIEGSGAFVGLGRNGEFASYEGTTLGDGRTLNRTYTPNGLDLTVAAAPSVRALEADDVPSGSPPAPATPAPALLAVDDSVRLARTRTLRIPARRLLANDKFAPGTRVRLVSRPRGASVRLDPRTGALRVRLRTKPRRTLRLRYRLVAPDGSRSRVATVRIRFRGPASR